MIPADFPSGRLYGDLAWLMPYITPPEEYADEAAHWRTVLRDHLGPGRHSLLELGAGSGHNLSHLVRDFDVTASDLSESMLEQCRHLNPGVPTLLGDMRHLRLNRTFDAVLIHDAISHMLTEADLRAAFRTAAAHLAPGGILITAPDRYRESFTNPETETATHSDNARTVTYFEYTRCPDPAGTTLDIFLTYWIENADGLRIEFDRLQVGIFPRATWPRLLEEAGFDAHLRTFPLAALSRPYELWVGTRRQDSRPA